MSKVNCYSCWAAMPCNYKRKTPRAEGYTKEALEKAVDDIEMGRKTIRAASRFYGIPCMTISHRVKGTRGVKGCIGRDGSGGGGRRQLTQSQEEELVACVKTMEKWGFALTRREILEIVQIFIQKNNIVSKFKDGKPGEDWFLAFKKRNRLSIKKPQHVEAARIKSRNPFTFYGFYDLLSSTITELDLAHKAHHIFNCDETSFCHDPKKTKVVGSIGNKTIRMTQGSGRENTSVLICASTAGELLPPLCIFKGHNILESWISTEPTNQTAYAASKKGWMNTTLFTNWFRQCFLPFVADRKPALLIYDGHSSHINTELIAEALKNDVTIIKLPPHTTDKLQPLDVSVNKALKDKWDDYLAKWQRANPRKRLPKKLFVELLCRALNEISKDVVVNGFKATGIYDMTSLLQTGSPLNEKAMKQSDKSQEQTIGENSQDQPMPEDPILEANVRNSGNETIIEEIPADTLQENVHLEDSNNNLEMEQFGNNPTVNLSSGNEGNSEARKVIVEYVNPANDTNNPSF